MRISVSLVKVDGGFALVTLAFFKASRGLAGVSGASSLGSVPDSFPELAFSLPDSFPEFALLGSSPKSAFALPTDEQSLLGESGEPSPVRVGESGTGGDESMVEAQTEVANQKKLACQSFA